MTIEISSRFDAGNILVRDASRPDAVRLDIRADHASDFFQWFYFRISGAKGQRVTCILGNAGTASYPKGWEGYRACVSADLLNWHRTETSYDGEALSITLTPQADQVYLAYWAPYSSQRHRELIASAARRPAMAATRIGETLDGRDLDMITVGAAGAGKRSIWVTCRQHPGETMAEWWAEGFLDRLSDPADPAVAALLDRAVVRIVPNMNPDGSARGHLRTNAAGTNLNREWDAPSAEASPEVLAVLTRMDADRPAIALDVHGDEALPYTFIAGAEGIPSWSDAAAARQKTFADAYERANGHFQQVHGYPVPQPGRANMTICTNALAERFGCLAMTLEMPFKDDANRPDPRGGWSPARSARLGADAVEPMLAALDAAG